MRYLRWGGDGEAVQPEKSSGVGNCLKCAQNPQRQVHALLARFIQYTFRVNQLPVMLKKRSNHFASLVFLNVFFQIQEDLHNFALYQSNH